VPLTTGCPDTFPGACSTRGQSSHSIFTPATGRVQPQPHYRQTRDRRWIPRLAFAWTRAAGGGGVRRSFDLCDPTESKSNRPSVDLAPVIRCVGGPSVPVAAGAFRVRAKNRRRRRTRSAQRWPLEASCGGRRLRNLVQLPRLYPNAVIHSWTPKGTGCVNPIARP
jgi:hypothetical protein